MTENKRILISGYYGFCNAGDEAVLSSIIAEIRKKSSDIDIAVLTADPDGTSASYGVTGIPRMSCKAIMDTMNKCDMLISGGGSLLQDVTSMKSLIYYLSIIKIALYKKKKVFICAQGIGPLNRSVSRKMVSSVLNKANEITVRDTESADLLKTMKVRKPEITISADPALLIEPADDESIDRLLAEIGIARNEEIIAISLREWDAANGLKDTVAKTLSELSEQLRARFLFVNMHMPHDAEASRSAAEHVRNAAIQSRVWTPTELAGVLGRCHMVIGMRLHALILAAAAGVPSIGISYDPKVEQFCKSAGQMYISLNDATGGNLSERARKAWDERAMFRAELMSRLPGMKIAAETNITKLFELLES